MEEGGWRMRMEDWRIWRMVEMEDGGWRKEDGRFGGWRLEFVKRKGTSSSDREGAVGAEIFSGKTRAH